MVYVYQFGSEPFYKIGKTVDAKNFKKRLSTSMVGSPLKLNPYAFSEDYCYTYEEGVMHEYFADFSTRENSEWFCIPDDVLQGFFETELGIDMEFTFVKRPDTTDLGHVEDIKNHALKQAPNVKALEYDRVDWAMDRANTLLGKGKLQDHLDLTDEQLIEAKKIIEDSLVRREKLQTLGLKAA